MSKSILLSTAYFPPISWVATLLRSGLAHIEAQETYAKQSYRNRCYIYGPNGMQSLIVPVSKPSGNKSKTGDVLIAPEIKWKKLHWRAIETAYNTSPFFLFYRDQIDEVLFASHFHLITFNHDIIKLLVELLGIRVSMVTTSVFEKEPDELYDLRNRIHPKKTFLHNTSFPAYTQVFSSKYGFIPDLSIIDLLFNEGPASIDYLNKITESLKIEDR